MTAKTSLECDLTRSNATDAPAADSAKVSRREFLQSGVAAGAALAALRPDVSAAQSAGAAGPDGVELAEWSWICFGIETATVARGPVLTGSNIYAEYQIPATVRHPVSVIFIHGGASQGLDWMGTPDGRPGWARLLVRQGYGVYVVDRPGQGRPPYYPAWHGNFGDAPTYEGLGRTATSLAKRDATNPRANLHTQWPGTGELDDPSVDQFIASLGQQMTVTNQDDFDALFRSRGSMMLDHVGQSMLITHGDGSLVALAAANERPNLVSGIIMLEPPALPAAIGTRFPNLTRIPIMVLTAEASRANDVDPGVVQALTQAGVPAEHVRLADRGIRGNGPYLMLEKNNQEALRPVVEWMARRESALPTPVRRTAPAESLAMSLADDGHFWVGVQRKQTAYGTVAVGQMFVEYLIPKEVKHPYPIVLVHGGGGQSDHWTGIGGRPGWVHYFLQDGYRVYVVDRPGHGRSPTHPDTVGPTHILLPNDARSFVGLWNGPQTAGTPRGTGLRGEDLRLTFLSMECNVSQTDLTYATLHSQWWEKGIGELLRRIGPSVLATFVWSGHLGWVAADRNPSSVKAILALEPNFWPFEAPLPWGVTAVPLTYDPPASDVTELRTQSVPFTPPTTISTGDTPRRRSSYLLQAEPARQLKNLKGIPMAWLGRDSSSGGNVFATIAFMKQAGCNIDWLRMNDLGFADSSNLFLLEKNNKQVFMAARDWLVKQGC